MVVAIATKQYLENQVKMKHVWEDLTFSYEAKEETIWNTAEGQTGGALPGLASTLRSGWVQSRDLPRQIIVNFSRSKGAWYIFILVDQSAKSHQVLTPVL